MPGQVYAVNTLGGNWSAPYLTNRLRSVAQPMFKLRQFIDVKEAIGKKRGESWLFDKAGNVATQGGTLAETNTIPETNYVTNQGTGTITEYGLAVNIIAAYYSRCRKILKALWLTIATVWSINNGQPAYARG